MAKSDREVQLRVLQWACERAEALLRLCWPDDLHDDRPRIAMRVAFERMEGTASFAAFRRAALDAHAAAREAPTDLARFAARAAGHAASVAHVSSHAPGVLVYGRKALALLPPEVAATYAVETAATIEALPEDLRAIIRARDK